MYHGELEHRVREAELRRAADSWRRARDVRATGSGSARAGRRVRTGGAAARLRSLLRQRAA
ncbi:MULTISPECIES: hypothetical protein [Streptomycetaceae]|uniref:Uncharacterized protein n=1 Tax=Streptantibioticus cattleyicolor (strain ATCC 35852 / DSM 46488 / JCM 4925 / NBRC 14057 / NRRL 8057) TaxID=1003195 RepID=F8JRI0_STREN|nr:MULTISPECIES: hypothetical protein [Streptomycetaceae]AEW96688.1 hypothetical protein SCATT_43170 [Streptantibioticus cattleyicolor NRRL 8057 = DSM 46488]MYS61179.1 hypothetical protein [Streptomyces sp. SID5468]CCB77028.1 protein of unknown function [Streptantibioticus cattleyicolor NRRL 8057 = DSM 46488]